ncbi:AAA family ATPase [Histomonas meleagridis]|uniref:AAA family ATPase n=1 Tax=Histomonas meleagridis TaxID=135588 RepID=UPI00355A2554|nr:AAA family ATPase [Histomonas meleagridis]KAH0796982.1 AAA family ATPase [Histomonas meleagridis]
MHLFGEFTEISSVDGYGIDERTSLHEIITKMKSKSILIEQIEDFSMKLTPRDLRLTVVLSNNLKKANFVIATSRNIVDIDASILSQFDFRFYLKPPDIEGRLSLLMNLPPDLDCPLSKQIKSLSEEQRIEVLKQFAGLQPSELLLSNSYEFRDSYSQLAGVDSILQKLDFLVLKPLTERILFDKIGVKSPRGILLIGRSGCGKSIISRTLGHASRISFFDISGVEIISKEFGESEKRLHSIFEKARSSSPSIVLFDDIDSIAPCRTFGQSVSEASDRLLTTLLVEMDGLNGRDDGVIILATTSRIDSIDPALLRPGRFDYIIEIPYPDENSRGQIFDLYTKDIHLDEPQKTRELVVKCTNNLSPANIEGIIREAALITLRNDLNSLSIPLSSFEKSLERYKKKNEENKLNLGNQTKKVRKSRF